MSCGIYKITNLINGHSYIGQSICIEERWKREKTRAFQPTQHDYNSLLGQAFRKYGLENFKFEILEECSQIELNTREQYYINKYNTYFNGYNQTIGGQQNGNFGTPLKISKEQLLEIYDLLQNSAISQNEIAQRYNVGKDVISTINHGKSRRLPGYNYPLRDNTLPINYCVDCGKEINIKATRCDACAKKLRRVSERPTKEELKILIRKMSFTNIGKQFGVSDNSIRKWCESYGLPKTKTAIKSYSDEEWKLI